MVNYSELSPLHPKIIEAIFLKKEQGAFMMGQFLPDRPVANMEFTYRYYGGVGGMSPEVSEGAETPLASVGYREKVDKCVEIREGDLISERALKFTQGIRNIVRDTTEYITERMMLRKEYKAIAAFDVDRTADGQPTAKTPTKTWDDTDETILADLADCITAIKKAGHVKADSLLIGSDEENSIAKADTLVQWNLAGQFGQQQIAQFAVNRLKGLDIYVTDMVVTSDENDPAAANTDLVTDKGYVFKRGADLGFYAVAEPFASRTIPVHTRRSIMLQIWQTVVPVITRPTHLIRLLNLHS